MNQLGTIINLDDGGAFDTESGLFIDSAGNVSEMSTADVQAMVQSTNDPGLLEQLITAAPSVLTFITAYQLSQINISRAQRGLAPLNTAQYGPQVGVGLSPATQQLITYGLVGLGAILLIGKMGGSKA